jgi:hypothetical protein
MKAVKTVSYPLRMTKGLVEIAKLRSEDERVDQSTALRHLVYVGAEEYVLQLVAAGRISAGRAADLLDVAVYDIYRLAEKHGIRLGATTAQIRKAEQTAEKLKV